jgi:hypothetical protein
MNIKTIKHWHHTKVGLLVFAVVELIVAYGFGSLSINSGNLWWYLLTIIFIVGTIQNITRLIGRFFNGNKATKA